MAEVIKMPKLGLSMQKGTIVKWLFKEGERVEKGVPIVEIETEKIINEVEAPIDGILLKIYIEEGDTVPILTPLGVIGKTGEKIDDGKEAIIETSVTKKKEELDTEKVHKVKTKLKFKQTGDIKASPVAVEYAAKLGMKLNNIQGTGPGGRIMKKYIKNYLKKDHISFPKEKKGGEGIGQILAVTKKLYDESEQKIPYTGMRKIIGDRLSQSKFTAPHIYFTISVDISKIQKLTDSFKKTSTPNISINDFIVFAVAKVLSEQPKINCSLIGEEIIYHKDINIGVAVALEEGLIVPVVRNADKKSLLTLSKEIKGFIKLSREGKLLPDDYKGGTFTVSNLGMYGIEEFTSIINPPEAAILAVGAIKKIPIVIREESRDKLEIRSIAKFTLSVDHRLIDGVIAAKFLNQLKYYLEFPEALIVGGCETL